jgi:hypothetical protein
MDSKIADPEVITVSSGGWGVSRRGCDDGRWAFGERQRATDAATVSKAVERAQLGDREALGFLYARYADDVHRYVRSIVHDRHEAENVTQQVFAKLVHVIGKYEERDVPFVTRILRVACDAALIAESTSRGAALATAASRRLQAEANPLRVRAARQAMPG